MKSVRSQIKNPNFQGFNQEDASFSLYSSSFLTVHDDQIDTFQGLLWSSRPLNDMQVFENTRGTFPLQPHFDEIKRLHPNSSIEVPKILSLISYHSIFRFWTDRVGTFK